MQLNFSLEEPLASHSASRDCEKDWLTLVATSRSPILRLLQDIAPAGWFGRTSPASFPVKAMSLPIRVRRKILWTWDATARKWKQKTSTSLKSSMHSTASWPDFQNSGMGTPTGLLTLNTSEWPKDAVVCSLSDTLETGDVPQRYYLSATACRGILRRAEKRGKELPERLRQALLAVAEAGNPQET